MATASSVISALSEFCTPMSFFVALGIGAASIAIALKNRPRVSEEENIYDLGGFSILNAWSFFAARYEFLRDNFKKTGQKIFRFYVLQHRVIALSGEEGRKLFFSEQGFHGGEAYRVLLGGAPHLSDIKVESDIGELDAGFLRRVSMLLRKERLSNLLPTLFDDIHRRMEDWGAAGTIDPFEDVYELAIQMTVRLATCRQLSEDKEATSRLGRHYWDLQKSATPFAILLPWFPSPAKKAHTNAMLGLFTMVSEQVDLRRKSADPSLDAIDVLIAQGDSNETIVGFVLGVIFAGVINTGMNICWALLYLGMDPHWKHKVITEVHALISKHTDKLSSEPLHKRLSTIPIAAWEDELPTLDAVIRETIRFTMSMTFLRRNLIRDVSIGDAIIRKGDFIAYSTPDVHADPDIYPDPQIFDPSRYSREEDKKVAFAYLGWGAGRHSCAGMKVARLEMKLVLALLLARYEYELVDASGKFPGAIPRPGKNSVQQGRPSGEPCYMRYRRIVD